MPWIKAPTSHSRGQITEAFAKQYLIQQGLVFIDNNVYCRQGEIDLVMQDGATFVFVEVKYRKNNHFGGAISAISKTKQNKIKHCVAFFLHKANLNEYNTPCRFDVIALEGDINQPQVTWLKNAF
ncbi:MAG: YraN family protein [Colwellia sp.]|nr:YraN family protein [Colwellia sp.]